jgi:SAM-dependent methyltransferase
MSTTERRFYNLNPATDPRVDYKAFVKRAYDTCAGAYDEARRAEPGPEIRELMKRLADGSHVLDVGCGAGVPIARSLAARHHVTGVDFSREMIQRARKNVPTGEFICADIMSATFPSSCFNAVVAFYSLFHLPRREHPELFEKLNRWLKPGGYVLCTLSHWSEEGYTEDGFFGVPMYWSNYSLEEYIELLDGAGFSVLESKLTGSGYEDPELATSEDHPLVLAQKQ